MMEICGDNRFEIIAKAKADLLESTNIETDEAEMAVIDNILFRCWQMGWLDRYDDRKTENCSEIPNNSTISKMEQVDKDINVRSKDEPQTDNGIGCSRCEGRFECYDRDMPHAVHCNNYGKITDEPQTERSRE